jgi:hypothetical protein
MPFGIGVFTVTGILIGLYLGSWEVVVGGAVFGAMLGAGVAKLGAHRFFFSVVAGTVLGGLIGWRAGGMDVVPLMAGTGSAVGGFIGITIEMLTGSHRHEREKRAP